MTAARILPLLLLIASAAIVGGAWAFQLWGGLFPCELCLYQRWPYYVVIALSLVALLAGRVSIAALLLMLAALAFLIGAGLAFYHVGVEQHWFAGPSACTGAAAAGSLEDFRRRLLAQQPVACDAPQWSLFGVTLAGWNLVASLLLVAFCLWGRRALGRSA
jgi:disulfide bond formation protein DsbB